MMNLNFRLAELSDITSLVDLINHRIESNKVEAGQLKLNL